MDGNGRWLDNIFVERAIPWASPTTATIMSESKSSFFSRSKRSKGARILAPSHSNTLVRYRAMALDSGSKLGGDEILAPLGSGGMGR